MALMDTVNTKEEIRRNHFGMSIGYASKKHLLIDFTFVHKTGLGGKLYFGINVAPGTEGENLDKTINWDEFSEDHVEFGSYHNAYDLGLGYYFDFLYIVGIFGFGHETVYRNCSDEFHILGDNGKYFKTKSGEYGLNYGGELGIIINKLTVSFQYTEYV